MAIIDSDTVENCLERIRSAWDAADARAYAQEFTEDATYVIFLGDALEGRQTIQATHADVLGKWQKGTKMALKVISQRVLDLATVSVLTVGGIGKALPITYDKFQTFTLVQREGRWLCAAFQNTKMSDQAKRQYNPKSGGLFARKT